MDVIEKIDFPWGGFDIAWDNDDLESEPFVLEVSPCFDPNPPPPLKFADDYYKFKYSAGFRFQLCLKDTIRKIANAQLDYLLG